MVSPAQSIDLASAMSIASNIYDRLEQDWRTDESYTGVYRPGYSVEETAAIKILAREAEQISGTAYEDLAGNVHIHFRSPHECTAPIMIASHIDAVPEGGRYDGSAGLIAGLAAVKALHDGNIDLAQDVILTVFRAEESAWWKTGTYGVGSKLLTRGLSGKFLDIARSKEDGKTLSDHMERIGLNPTNLAVALDREGIFPYHQLGSYLEAHIEQGPSLFDVDKSLGIVTDIRGNLRFPGGITFLGESAHSGATPQHLRQDAVIAGGNFISEWSKLMQSMAEHSDLVFSVPNAYAKDASATSVPDEFFIMPEVRSTNVRTLETVKKKTLQLAQKIAEEWKTRVSFDESGIVMSYPSNMDLGIHDTLLQGAIDLGIDAQSMPSGAGHDAGVMANAGVSSNMIFIRHGNSGISHNPNEILGRDNKENPFQVGSDFSNAVYLMAHHVSKGQVNPSQRSEPTRVIFKDCGINCFTL